MTDQLILFQSLANETNNLATRMLPDFNATDPHRPPSNGQGGVKCLEFTHSIKALEQRPNIRVHRRMTDRNHEEVVGCQWSVVRGQNQEPLNGLDPTGTQIAGHSRNILLLWKIE
jgi:hypothetical protein